jgi:hypothetical protein
MSLSKHRYDQKSYFIQKSPSKWFFSLFALQNFKGSENESKQKSW